MNALLAAWAAALLTAAPAAAQDLAAPAMPGMDHSQMSPAQPEPGHDMAGMDMSHMDMPGMDHAMRGALGAYAMTREASGTSWQPDASTHEGLHLTAGAWMAMVHGVLNAVYDKQYGPRGDEKGFVSGMLMAMGQRPVGEAGTLQLRAMISPDPFMGPSGYPLLLATGETADGKAPLVDRQHPHDLFMELSASYSHRLSATDSVFVYAGLPGEPAFGPPAFMHRMSILDSPEAPKLDSTAVRLSWNPTANWSLQASWADEKSPEQLDPEVNQRKLSASGIYTVPIGDRGWWSTTAAWGRRSSQGIDLDAWVLESAVKPNAAWTIFGRAERVDNDELISVAGHHGPVFTVGKVSVGAVRDWPLSNHLSVGLGALYAFDFVPSALDAAYGRDPRGGMVFTRIKLR